MRVKVIYVHEAFPTHLTEEIEILAMCLQMYLQGHSSLELPRTTRLTAYQKSLLFPRILQVKD